MSERKSGEYIKMEHSNMTQRDFKLTKESEALRKALVETLGEAVEGGPKVAIFQIYINRIFRINDAEETVEVDFYVKVNWQDKKYIGVTDDEFQENEHRLGEGWWDPGVEISNGVDLEKLIEREESFWIEDPEHGILAYTQRYIGKISSPMELQFFPFDCQVVSLIFESFHWKADDLILKRLPTHAYQARTDDPNFVWYAIGRDVKLTEWIMHAAALSERMNYYAFEDRTYSQILVKIALQRQQAYYLSKILFFIVLIVAMSWSVFFMETSDVSSRVSITVTLFLAIVAFNFVLSSSLPKISYNTSLDAYLIVSYIYIFLSLVQSIVVFLVQKYNTEDNAEIIDWASIAIFAGTYIIYNVIFLGVAFRRSRRAIEKFHKEEDSRGKKEA